MKSRTVAWLLLAVGMLFVAGCKVNSLTTIKPDGSGEFRTEMGLTADEVKQFGSLSSGGTDNICSAATQSGESLPKGTTFQQEQRGSETWCVAVIPFATLDELKQMYGQLSGVTVNQLESKDGQLLYDVSLDLAQEGTAPVPVQATWQVTVPGPVVSNNADKADGSTLTWNLTAGQTVEIKAISSIGGLSMPFAFPAWVYAVILSCICLAALVVLAVVAIVLLRRRKPTPGSN